MKKIIYLDNAAATPLAAEVKKEILRGLSLYANPSSFNDAGREVRKELEAARKAIAKFIGAGPAEIIFTGSGSEANNLAVLGAAKARAGGGKEILTTPLEHASVLKPLESLRSEFKLIFLKVDEKGLVDLADLKRRLTPKVFLVSVMYANNEIGTIEPIKKISKIIKDFKKQSLSEHYPLFHVDACQAVEYLDVNVNNLGVDLLSFNGTKIYGPRGIGVLYVRRGVPVRPLVLGGEHERGLRAGTENLSAILGLAKALELINSKEGIKIAALRDYFFKKLAEIMPDTKINGALGGGRLPNNVNISIPGTNSEKLLLELDKYGIRAGSGSACTSHAVEPSHVLKAIGVREPYLDGVLRFSLGRQTTQKDIDFVVKILQQIVKKAKQP